MTFLSPKIDIWPLTYIDKNFLDYINARVEKVKKENKLLFITVDFNLNILNLIKNDNVNTSLETMLSNPLQTYIIYPSWIVDNANQPLFIIFSKSVYKDILSGNLIVKISDKDILSGNLIVKISVKDILSGKDFW